MMTLKEHRRAKWRLRRESRRIIRAMVNAIRYRIDTARLEHFRSRAWHGGPEEANEYWEAYKRYWREWG